jgi:hypothetical protein
MAKKGKKFEATEAEVQAAGQAMQSAGLPPDAPGKDAGAENGSETAEQNGEAKVARQSAYLQLADGTQYQVVARPNLPKRAGKAPDGDLKIKVDGREYPAWVTSSKGWAAEDKVIDYIWVLIPQEEGSAPVSGFITLDYLVPATQFANAEFTLGFGKANRSDPPRVARDQAKEDNRKLLFAQTMAQKKALTPEEQAAAEAALEAEGQAEQEGTGK